MVGWKACSLWRSFGRLRDRGESGKCAEGRWRQACQARQDRKGRGNAGTRRRYPRGALNASPSPVTRDALELLICVGKELIGSALPAVPGDELDVTLGDELKKQTETTGSDVTPPRQSPGINIVTKLIFFGVIVGVVLSFLKTRGKPVVEKSLA